ncbi:hypothetical protein [Epilithonimonas caeni]|uniref:hypothetical protein n=1 Tax=Epilithonimonas caeni TaxID=365343 RepID=UPI001F185D3A|nr:hypothetical protein [Epilithonimonas caeni]
MTNAQSYGLSFNDRLLAQITKNQVVRLASNESFLNSYKKQNEFYDDINKKIVQIIAIQEFIYKNLSNVNGAIKQSKKLIQIGKLLTDIGTNSADMLKLSAQHPEYSILLYETYARIVDQALTLQEQVTKELLNEENDFLMDQYDREKILNNIYTKASIINSDILYIILKIKNRKTVPYLYQVPLLSEYINLDKYIINNIINQYKWSF